jgi:hypothetical protein
MDRQPPDAECVDSFRCEGQLLIRSGRERARGSPGRQQRFRIRYAPASRLRFREVEDVVQIGDEQVARVSDGLRVFRQFKAQGGVEQKTRVSTSASFWAMMQVWR